MPLNITRIVASADINGDPLNMAVNDIIIAQTFNITGRVIVGAQANISVSLTNIGNPNADPPVLPLCTGYPLYRIWFLASDPDDGEIPYAVSQFASPNYVPAYSERPWTYNGTFGIVTGNASEVIVNIDPAGLVTREQMERYVAENTADTADEISYDDSVSKLGAENVQEAVEKIIDKADDHIEQSIPSETGVHGTRYYNGKLQVRNGTAWEDAKSGAPTAWQQWLNNPIDLDILNAIMLQGSDNMGMKIFEANGTFELVAGRIYKVIVIGAGASGAANNNNALKLGQDGAASSFGAYISAEGGTVHPTSAIIGGIGRNSGGAAGMDGTGVNGGKAGKIGTNAGGGGAGGFEFMGKAADAGIYTGTNSPGSGGGGYGAGAGGASIGGAGGGSGLIKARIFKAEITETIAVTVGVGGTASNTAGAGSKGANGAVIVCWDDAA